MKVKVKLVETAVKYVIADVDSLDPKEIQAVLNYMSCKGQIDWDRVDEYSVESEVIGIVEKD